MFDKRINQVGIASFMFYISVILLVFVECHVNVYSLFQYHSETHICSL